MRETDDNLISAFANVRRQPNVKRADASGECSNQVVVRFWIITMLLVLFGLSTLKLR
jgi:phospho-N-acetylmuramoyl-pentapeptide-transferase